MITKWKVYLLKSLKTETKIKTLLGLILLSRIIIIIMGGGVLGSFL